VAVPHRPDETRVLRNLGFEVPDPMPIYYEWPKVSGRHDPFEAQRHTASFLSMNSRAYCLNGMGTGKTNSTLWAFDYLRRTRQVNKMLVVCPLSTMERTWSDSIFNTFPHLDCVVLHGSRAKRLKLLEEDVHIYIINHDGIDIIADAMAERPDIDIIAVDELAPTAGKRSIVSATSRPAAGCGGLPARQHRTRRQTRGPSAAWSHQTTRWCQDTSERFAIRSCARSPSSSGCHGKRPRTSSTT
jgi:hypothetical protein